MSQSLPLLTEHQAAGLLCKIRHSSACVLQFISRPFVVGDRIEISSVGGSKFVVGTVERVDPMRTIIRTDACMPITIPNKVGPVPNLTALPEHEAYRRTSMHTCLHDTYLPSGSKPIIEPGCFPSLSPCHMPICKSVRACPSPSALALPWSSSLGPALVLQPQP